MAVPGAIWGFPRTSAPCCHESVLPRPAQSQRNNPRRSPYPRTPRGWRYRGVRLRHSVRRVGGAGRYHGEDDDTAGVLHSRPPSRAAGELAGASELGWRGRTVEQYRGKCLSKTMHRHRIRIGRLRRERKSTKLRLDLQLACRSGRRVRPGHCARGFQSGRVSLLSFS
jgi:hypothetical protein